MPKKLYIYIITLIVLVGITIYFLKKENKPAKKYYEEWIQIERFRQQNLPDSMLSKINYIYHAASKEKNYEQVVKAIVYQVNHIGYNNNIRPFIVENYDNTIELLKKEAEILPQPSRSIIYSIIGQMYETYYDQHARSINSRTYVTVNLEDIHTWSAQKIIEEAIHYYNLSLKEKRILQETKISDYREVITSSSSIFYQPTLYDLLARRALSFYASSFNTNVLYDDFIINDPDYFADAKTFVKKKIPVSDANSPAYLSLKTY